MWTAEPDLKHSCWPALESESARDNFLHLPYQLPYGARQFVQRLGKSRISFGGRYWDRTSGPCRVKRGVGAYTSTICESGSQLQQALSIT
jgi:hypothetical protein